MHWLKKNLAAVGGGALAVAVIVVLAVADSSRFEDAEYTPLYKATLEDAFSKFKESDKRVPARGAVDPGAEAMFTPPAAVAQQPFQSPVPGMLQGMGQGAAGSVPGGTAPGAAAGSGAAGHVHDDGGVHMKLGNEHLGKGEYDKAAAEYRLALQENPSRSLAAHQIADALRAAGRFDEAVAAYVDVVAKFKTYQCCYTHIGDMYRERKDPAKADEYYDKAAAGFQAQVAEGGPQATIGKYHLARLHLDRGRNQAEALKLAQEAVAEAPDQAMYLLLLSQSYQALGRRNEALAAIDKAIAMNPENIEVYRTFRQQLTSPATQPAVPPPA